MLTEFLIALPLFLSVFLGVFHISEWTFLESVANSASFFAARSHFVENSPSKSVRNVAQALLPPGKQEAIQWEMESTGSWIGFRTRVPYFLRQDDVWEGEYASVIFPSPNDCPNPFMVNDDELVLCGQSLAPIRATP